VAAALVAPTLQAQGGAVALYEFGTLDMGHAAAGAGARAQDAATVFYNPAGMTLLERPQVVAGFGLGFVNSEFDLDLGGTVTVPAGETNDGGSLDSIAPVGGQFFSTPVGRNFWLGVSLNGLYGGSLDYDDDWVGRTFVTESRFIGFNAQPSAAYRVNDWLSLGIGLDIVYAKLDVDLRSGSAPGDGFIKIDDADDFGIGGTVSALLTPREGTRIGIVYRTGADLELDGKFKNPTPITFNVGADIDFAQGVNVSLYQDISQELSLLVDAGWSDWSEFGYIPTTITGPIGFTQDRSWKDTWRIGVGLEWRFEEDWTLRIGGSFDSSPVGDSDRLPDLPVGEQWRFGVGVSHDLNEDTTLGLSYTWLHQVADIDSVTLPPLNNVTLSGEYDPNDIHFLGFTLIWRF
jgi:long-chain fatty acid transport protein